MNSEIKMINKTFSQLIITFAFFYSAIICYFKARIFFDNQEYLLCFVLSICSISAFMGALRFQIQKLVDYLKKK